MIAQAVVAKAQEFQMERLKNLVHAGAVQVGNEIARRLR